MKIDHFLLLAGISFAIVFMFSCSSSGEDDNSGSSSSSSVVEDSSSSVVLSSSATGDSSSSSETTGGLDSSSSAVFSSSSVDGDSSSSNEVTGSSSSVVSPGCPSYNASTHFCDSRDSKVYKKVKIGTQIWMAENLNYNAEDSRCYGDNTGGDSYNRCGTYGRLYNWTTTMDGSASSTANPSGVRGVCPSGWHIPSNAEWDALYHSADGTNDTGNLYDSPTAGRYLKATNGWNSGGNGQDTYGFAALPGGYVVSDGFFSAGLYGYWWTASEGSSIDYAYFRYMSYSYESAYWDDDIKISLYSVRCVQD